MKKHYIIPISIMNTKEKANIEKQVSNEVTKEEMIKTVETYLKQLKGKEVIKQLLFQGGAFTTLPEQKQEQLLEQAKVLLEEGKIDEIKITTTTKGLGKQELKRLKKAKVSKIELTVPSSNDYLLEKAGIEESFGQIKKIAKQIRWYRFWLGFQFMVGLPESTKIDELNTAKELLKLKPNEMRITPVVISQKEEIEEKQQERNFEPLSLVQAVERCKELVYLCNRKKISLLHIDETKKQKEEKVKGPVHPDFPALVESSIWYDSIVDQIKQYNTKVREVEITVNPQDINHVIGYEQENIKKLEETYDVLLKVVMDSKVRQGKSEMKIVKTYADLIEEKQKQEKITK